MWWPHSQAFSAVGLITTGAASFAFTDKLNENRRISATTLRYTDGVKHGGAHVAGGRIDH
jgi:hypothetical protein